MRADMIEEALDFGLDLGVMGHIRQHLRLARRPKDSCTHKSGSDPREMYLG